MLAMRAAVLIGLMVPTVMSIDPAAAQSVNESVAVGPDLPPQGRSLFDRIAYVKDARGAATLQLAFPFNALVAQLRERLRLDARPDAEPDVEPGALQAVLIPFGRSLQRNAAAPDFLHSPRVVLAVLGESLQPTAPLAKDRLYLGYQDRAGVIEVISYNDALGRFEFQIVKDYRAQRQPRLFYAKRAICMACHQNQAPIFSRPLWSETHANPQIAARLHAERMDFHGVDLTRGIDVPAAIDAATDRANAFALEQRLWREGCASLARMENEDAETRCRAALLDAALKLRLSGWRGYAEGAAATLDALRAHWRAQWPNGWSVPNPDIPNRDPLALMAHAPLRAVAVPASVDPLRLRQPLGQLDFADSDALRGLIQGLANTFTQADIVALDALLFTAKAVPIRKVQVPCRVRRQSTGQAMARLDLDCDAESPDGTGLRLQGRLYFNGKRLERGALDQLQIGMERFADITLTEVAEVSAGRMVLTPMQNALHARRKTGHALAQMTLQLSGAGSAAEGDATLILNERQDYTVLETALRDLATVSAQDGAPVFADQPLRRERILPAVYAQLGHAASDFCCAADGLPAAEVEAYAPLPTRADSAFDPAFAAVLPTLERYCSACHASAETFPPNFLSGTAEQVRARLAQCAERIDYRMSMWGLDAPARGKSPMPPALLVPAPERLQGDPEWQRLRAYVGALRTTRPAHAAQEYEQLAPCVAEGG